MDGEYEVKRMKGRVVGVVGRVIEVVGNDGNGRCREVYLINVRDVLVYVRKGDWFGI